MTALRIAQHFTSSGIPPAPTGLLMGISVLAHSTQNRAHVAAHGRPERPI